MAPRKKSSSATAASSGVSAPQHEEIAVRAYEFFLQRGCAHGWDLQDWFQAEREIVAKQVKKPARRRKSETVEVSVS